MSVFVAAPTFVAAIFLITHEFWRTVITMIYAGLALGSLLPDVDASDAKIMHGYWGVIGFIGKYLFYKPMSFLLGLKSDAYREKHRGYLHSLVGCLLTTIFFGVLLGIVAVPNPAYAYIPLSALVGIPLGFLLHLAEDSFTRSGVRWFFPRDRVLSGQISTYRKQDVAVMETCAAAYASLAVVAYFLPRSWLTVIGIMAASVLVLGVLYLIHPRLSS
jgi:membrane-bound metal-dependent hydrolase YbcI (DUF457 family)